MQDRVVEQTKKGKKIEVFGEKPDTAGDIPFIDFGMATFLNENCSIGWDKIRENAEFRPCKAHPIVLLDEEPEDSYIQDPDTLDTWFSSGLWTFSTLGWPHSAQSATRGKPDREMT